MMAPVGKVRISFCKTLWGVGVSHGNHPEGYGKLFHRIKQEGFSAVETPIWMIEDKAAFASALKDTGLGYVAMINTCTPAGDNNGSKQLQHHIDSFEKQIDTALSLSIRPLLINSHSGCDSWNVETAKAFFTHALQVEDKKSILICHETHRGRILYNPWITRDLCRHFPNLKLTADLSHFCVVAERVFASDDADWAECMDEISRATKHIHARVGYAQGPQVPDPRAPEYRSALEAHEGWWDRIITTQAALGGTHITVEPEHGTDGYQQRLPWVETEMVDLWVVNKWLRDHEAQRMGSQSYFVQ